jgi:hypothetical protein
VYVQRVIFCVYAGWRIFLFVRNGEENEIMIWLYPLISEVLCALALGQKKYSHHI